MVKTYLFLVGAIFCEVAGTMLLPVSQNFTKLIPTTLLTIFYLSAFYLLTFVVNKLPIAIVYATIGGAALGYVTEALLGNHDGHQYIINIDDSEDDVAIVQGSETKLSNNDRVVIIFGKTIRVLPYDG